MCWRRNAVEQRYALKEINTRFGDHASISRIKEEINILQTLGSHRSLVSLVDVDEQTSGKIRLVLELCEGGELYDRIQQKQYYPEHEAKQACYNLLEACQYIHSKGIMHRDLKPENILLQSKVSNVDIKISDFGLAKISRDYPRRLPRSHSICGSDFYLARRSSGRRSTAARSTSGRWASSRTFFSAGRCLSSTACCTNSTARSWSGI
eukprot:SRR837773.24460.p1 GENE.SRR837773.24460~~SRR837773.24460.p1  ORF type:complete len:215 (-),score=70.29 SRR837773.24460:133-756(-)